MTLESKKVMVTLLPEWEPMLDRLKEEQFYNDTQAEMFRYLIERGLVSLRSEKAEREK